MGNTIFFMFNEETRRLEMFSKDINMVEKIKLALGRDPDGERDISRGLNDRNDKASVWVIRTKDIPKITAKLEVFVGMYKDNYVIGVEQNDR